jgi:ABC-type transport system involved in multi-copper enzyme maturation permease subunit
MNTFKIFRRITFFLPAFTGCFAILIDRKNGTLDRSMVAGITRMELIFSLFITEGVAIVLQSIVSYCCALYVFEGTFEGSHLAFIMVIICTGVAGLCFGKKISAFCTEASTLGNL